MYISELKNCRYPVSLEPEDAIRIVSLLHDIKTRAAGLNDQEIFDNAAAALAVTRRFVPFGEK